MFALTCCEMFGEDHLGCYLFFRPLREERLLRSDWMLALLFGWGKDRPDYPTPFDHWEVGTGGLT